VSIDFFAVPTATFRVLFVVVVLAHHRRHLVHFNITGHPTATWIAQQIREAFPEDRVPRYRMIRDRDGVYGVWFHDRVREIGSAEVLMAPQSPWQNAFAERLIGSIRRSAWTTRSFWERSTCQGFCAANRIHHNVLAKDRATIRGGRSFGDECV
jgi:hypothetical protein